MHALTRFRRRSAQEGGNVLLSVLIIFVASIAVLATLSTVTGGLDLARNDQARANAFQLANGGVDQVLYRIDRQDLPVAPAGTYVPTVVAGKVTAFTEKLTIDGSTYEVSAVHDPPGQSRTWRVNAVGTDQGSRQRRAVATIEAESIFEEAFFTEETFHLTGNQTKPTAYDSRVCPSASPSCELPVPVPGRIGTNATFEGSAVEHFAARWEGFNMYGRASQAAADAACDGGACGTTPKVRAITDRKVVLTPDVPAGVQPCPPGGTMTGTIPPGDYNCTNVNLQGIVTVGGATGNVRLWVSGTFAASAGSVVNAGQRTTRFQVYQDEGVTGGGSICGAELWALLYTPGLRIDCPGDNQPKVYGAVVADTYTGRGNQFDFHWDVSAAGEVNRGLFNIRDWRECPVSVADC